MIEIDGKQYREVLPCGKLWIVGAQEAYILLSPHPIDEDWDWNERRFVVVPDARFTAKGVDFFLYDYARHVVVGAPFVIEYQANWNPIHVLDLGDIDLSNFEWKPEREQPIEPEDLFNDETHPVRDVHDVIREHDEKLADDGFPY